MFHRYIAGDASQLYTLCINKYKQLEFTCVFAPSLGTKPINICLGIRA